MTTREKFKRAVIEAIHGLPYEEAVKKEFVVDAFVLVGSSNYKENKKDIYQIEKIINDGEEIKLKYGEKIKPSTAYDLFDGRSWELLGLPITIGRVMQALCECHIKEIEREGFNASHGFMLDVNGKITTRTGLHFETVCNWKLTKENGQECTDDEQADECIEKLLELLETK